MRVALAHRIAAEIESGIYADVARRHGLTRARLSQLVDLTRLAPDLQELVLALRYTPGREAITERKLRGIAATPLWSEQRRRRVAVPGWAAGGEGGRLKHHEGRDALASWRRASCRHD